jgi:uncharacterized membrane protein YqhA
METNWMNIDDTAIQKDEEQDLIERIREKREKNNLENEEKISDVFVTQALVCVGLCLILLVVNLFAKGFSSELLEKYHEKTTAEIEDFVLSFAEKIDVAI